MPELIAFAIVVVGYVVCPVLTVVFVWKALKAFGKGDND